MAITYNANVRDIVQEAFNLLRQDFTAPAVAATPVDIDSVSDTSSEWLKAKVSLKTAANEVFDAFGWGTAYTAEGIGSWAAKMRNALVYTLARELAIPVAGRIEDMKVFASLAAEKLRAAEVKALNDAMDGVTDADTQDVVALLVESFSGDKPLPHSVASVTNRIDTLKDTARRDVILAHDWNFASVAADVVADLDETVFDGYPWQYTYPSAAMRLSAVSGPDGRLAAWKVENGTIRCRERFTRIRYVKDVTDMTKWPAMVRPLFVMRLKALVARTVTGSANDAALQEQLYRQALAEAKLADARESHTPTDPWGDNHHVEAMRGAVGPFRRESPFWR